jgi:uncharacterized protein YneF (UPF0154 family)
MNLGASELLIILAGVFCIVPLLIAALVFGIWLSRKLIK